VLYPEPPEHIRDGGIRGALKLFGPGAIMASVTIGSGETLFASRAGAIFGYALLWFVFLAIVCKLIQVYTGARYMVLSGEHPMEAWARLPGPRGWFPAALGAMSVFCFPFWLGGLSMMLGTALNWIFGLDGAPAESQRLYAQLFGTTTLIVAAVLTVVQSYKALEVVQTGIVALLLVSILAAIVPSPVDWPEAVRGAVAVGWPRYEAWMVSQYPKIVGSQTVRMVMAIFMGAIGGGTYDYIGYLSFFREKKWGALGVDSGQGPDRPSVEPSEANVSVGRMWLRGPIVDVFVGFGCVLLFTLAFCLLGAALLHPQHIVPDEFALLTPQVRFLTQFGKGFKYLYQLGIFMAFWGTIYGAFEVYSRTAYECLRPLFGQVRDMPFARFRLPVCLYAGIGGIVLMWTLRDPMKIVQPAALIGTTTCGLWCFAMIWTDRTVLPPGLRMNRVWLLLNLIAGIVLTGFGLMAIRDYLS